MACYYGMRDALAAADRFYLEQPLFEADFKIEYLLLLAVVIRSHRLEMRSPHLCFLLYRMHSKEKRCSREARKNSSRMVVERGW